MRNINKIVNLLVLIVTPFCLVSCMSMLRNLIDGLFNYFLIIFIVAFIFVLKTIFTKENKD